MQGLGAREGIAKATETRLNGKSPEGTYGFSHGREFEQAAVCGLFHDHFQTPADGKSDQS